jgi:predicted ribosome quality control (RQC) complex YloA/Tae2 family protein
MGEITNIHIFEERLRDSTAPPSIQKIFSSNHFINLNLRFQGVSSSVYVGRGPGYSGVFFSHEVMPSALRIQDVFLEYIRKHFKNKRLLELSLNSQKKMATFTLRSKSVSYFSFHWKKDALYFQNIFLDPKGQKKQYHFKSWRPQEKKTLFKPSPDLDIESFLLEEFEVDVGVQGGEFDQINIENYSQKEIDKQTAQKFPGRKKKFFSRKLSRIENDLKRCELASRYKEELKMGPEESIFEQIVTDLKISKSKLRGLKDYKKRDLLFQKLKSFENAKEILTKRKEDTLVELKKWENSEISAPNLQKCIRPFWKELISKNPHCQFYKLDNCLLALGKNQKGNVYLRNNWAQKDDLWFHLKDTSSAHLFVRGVSKENLTPEVLDVFASVLISNPSSEFLDISLSYAKASDLRGISKTQGAVTIKNPLYATAKYKKDWKEHVKTL